MLIPSIDLMGGCIVQLQQGSRKMLESSDFDGWSTRFACYPMVQLIDLDAALGSGNNAELVRRFTNALPCQVGGGLRDASAVRACLETGARRAIVGSALFRNGEIQIEFAKQLAEEFGRKRLVFAVDARNGRVAIKGWKEQTPFTPAQAVQALSPFCSAFLYTNVETEGMMQGLPKNAVRELRACTERQLIVAGGIRSRAEVDELEALGADAVVGMAIYTNAMEY